MEGGRQKRCQKRNRQEKVTVIAPCVCDASVHVRLCEYEQDEGLDRTKRTSLPTQMTSEPASKSSNDSQTPRQHTHAHTHRASQPFMPAGCVSLAANTSRLRARRLYRESYLYLHTVLSGLLLLI